MADEGVVFKGELFVKESPLLAGRGWWEVEGIVLGILDTLGKGRNGWEGG